MIGQKIKSLRQQKGYLSQLERGLQTNPSLQFLVKVAALLDTSVQYLLEDSKLTKHGDSELDEEWMKEQDKS